MKATRITYANDSKYQAKADPRDRRAVLASLASVPESILALGPEMVQYWRSKPVKLHDADASETPGDIQQWARSELVRVDEQHNGWRKRHNVVRTMKKNGPEPTLPKPEDVAPQTPEDVVDAFLAGDTEDF